MVETCRDLLLSSLSVFYENNTEYKYLLKEIIDGHHKLSLRLIDWFVTHYSKTHNISYWITADNYHLEMPLDYAKDQIPKRISLYMDYRDQLKSYTKINFDSFRRHARITFVIDPNKYNFIDTTVGQLNFFRWIFKNKILQYIENNYDTIYNDMILNNCKFTKKIISSKTQGITNTLCTLHFD